MTSKLESPQWECGEGGEGEKIACCDESLSSLGGVWDLWLGVGVSRGWGVMEQIRGSGVGGGGGGERDERNEDRKSSEGGEERELVRALLGDGGGGRSFFFFFSLPILFCSNWASFRADGISIHLPALHYCAHCNSSLYYWVPWLNSFPPTLWPAPGALVSL